MADDRTGIRNANVQRDIEENGSTDISTKNDQKRWQDLIEKQYPVPKNLFKGYNGTPYEALYQQLFAANKATKPQGVATARKTTATATDAYKRAMQQLGFSSAPDAGAAVAPQAEAASVRGAVSDQQFSIDKMIRDYLLQQGLTGSRAQGAFAQNVPMFAEANMQEQLQAKQDAEDAKKQSDTMGLGMGLISLIL